MQLAKKTQKSQNQSLPRVKSHVRIEQTRRLSMQTFFVAKYQYYSHRLHFPKSEQTRIFFKLVVIDVKNYDDYKASLVTVSEANLNYIGSITIDQNFFDAVGILENEKSQIFKNNNGARLETYFILVEEGLVLFV